MTYGFQLVVVQSPTYRIVGASGQSWKLPSPVGLVTVHGAPDTLKDATELTFRSVGFESEDGARAAGEVFLRWLQAASALGSFAFDFGQGRERQKSWLGDETRAELERGGTYVVDDIHGLVVFEERGNRPIRVSLRASPTVQQQSDALRNRLEDVASGPLPEERVALAAALVSLSQFIASRTMSFLILVTAAEVLAQRPARQGPAASMIGEFINQATQAVASLDEPERSSMRSVVGALKDLKRESIGRSIRELAAKARPGDPNATRLATRIYTCRSELLHDGVSHEDPWELLSETRQLLIDMLVVSLAS